MIVSVMLDRVKYSDKPSSDETGKISNRIKAMAICKGSTELEISDLAKALTQGRTCIPAVIGKPDRDGAVA